MLDWFKNINREYPEFWKSYLAKFEKKPGRYVALHGEKSGTDPQKDVIYSFSGFSLVNEQLLVGDNFECVLLQYKFLHDNGYSNEFLVKSPLPKMTEQQAVEALVGYIGNSVLIGYRIHHLVELVNESLETMACGRLKNEALDIEIMYRKWKESDGTFSLADIASGLKIEYPEQPTVSDDSYLIGLAFLKLWTRLHHQS